MFKGDRGGSFQGPLLKLYPSVSFLSERGLCVYEMGTNNGSRFESKLEDFLLLLIGTLTFFLDQIKDKLYFIKSVNEFLNAPK